MKTFLPKSKLGTYATHQIFGFWKTLYLSTKFLDFEKFGTTWLYIRRRTKFLDFEKLGVKLGVSQAPSFRFWKTWYLSTKFFGVWKNLVPYFAVPKHQFWKTWYLNRVNTKFLDFEKTWCHTCNIVSTKFFVLKNLNLKHHVLGFVKLGT